MAGVETKRGMASTRKHWLALLVTGVASSVTFGADDATAPQAPSLEEVTVTAQKRSERLLDVPAAVSSISGENLQSLHVSDLADLSYYVPGLSVADYGVPGFRTVVIRGLYSGNTSAAPMAGTYLDDLSIGEATGAAAGETFGIDLNPYDVDRVEVLKGPQGTLYGANTMAGLVKYSLKQPDLNSFEANVGTSLESIDYSQSPSWGVHGAISAPLLSDVLAVRVSAFDKRDAGYIDNLYSGEKGFNSDRETGGLATVLWKPDDRLTVKGVFVTQDVNVASAPLVAYNTVTEEPAYGSLAVNSAFLSPLTNSTRIYSLSLGWNLDFATLSSTSGWTHFKLQYTSGNSAIGALCASRCPDYPFATAQATYTGAQSSDKFVQEVRLASPDNQRLQWLVGGFFSHETTTNFFGFSMYTAQLVPLPARNSVLFSQTNGDYKERAGFADLTFKFNDRFDLSAGGRYSTYSSATCNPVYGGLLVGNAAPAPCTEFPSSSVALWMTNARFHLSQDAMLYVRAATGYRPGYGCPTCYGAPFGISGIVKADQTTDFETGFKAQFLNNRLQFDTDVYHTIWHDMQSTAFVANGTLTEPTNAGRAISNGWEFTAAYLVTTGLTLSGSLDYSDAHLTEDLPALKAKAGDPLIESPRWSGAFRVDYTRSLFASYEWLLGGDYRYKDWYVDGFMSSGPRWTAYRYFAPQNLVNLYTGISTHNATVRLYVSNVFNRFDIQNLLGSSDVNYKTFAPVRPRTIGLSLDYKF